jgi:plastocyanin
MKTIAPVILALAACGACKKKDDAPPPPPPPADADVTPPPPVAEGKGTIRGKVAFAGAAPAAEALKTSADPFCAKFSHKDESVLVNANGTVKNAVVRLVNAPKQAAAGLAPAKLDQSTCVYRPRVQGVVEGQTLVITNSDKTLHNVHTYLDDKTVFNKAQPPVEGLPPVEWVSKAGSGGLFVARCDVHPWMRAYVAVTPHPWFAVTGEDGAFELKDVPAGTWQIEAWQEKYGTQKQEVKVDKDAVAEVSFSFAASP